MIIKSLLVLCMYLATAIHNPVAISQAVTPVAVQPCGPILPQTNSPHANTLVDALTAQNCETGDYLHDYDGAIRVYQATHPMITVDEMVDMLNSLKQLERDGYIQGADEITRRL